MIKNTTNNIGGYLVLCEVYSPDGQKPHASNSRAKLRQLMESGADADQPWMGFEQEYVFYKNGRPLGWPDVGSPAPQGPYYCGVGSGRVESRDLVLEHAKACMEAGLLYCGWNAEVMPGQWEYQVGARGNINEAMDPLTVCDQAWLARYMLYKIAEKYDISISLENKPVKGDWNGSGMHTNVSTIHTRNEISGLAAITSAIENLAQYHSIHIKLYGDKLEERLTGHHETSSIEKFSHGQANRGCSVRIPRHVQNKGYGYFEDRRPGANADPYNVAACIVEAICGKHVSYAISSGVEVFTK